MDKMVVSDTILSLRQLLESEHILGQGSHPQHEHPCVLDYRVYYCLSRYSIFDDFLFIFYDDIIRLLVNTENGMGLVLFYW